MQEIIRQFRKNNIVSKGKRFFDATKKIEESKKKTGESVFELIEVPKDQLDSIKLKISRNKTLSTTISTGKYALSDTNDLVNKTDSKSISRAEAINSYNDIAEKDKEIAGLRQAKNWQKNLTNY